MRPVSRRARATPATAEAQATEIAAQELKDEARIRYIESENMWRGMIDKELADRLRRQVPVSQVVRVSRPNAAELIAAVRDGRLHDALAYDSDLRERLRAVRERVKAVDEGRGAASVAGHHFLNSNHLASNAHMFNKVRRRLRLPAPDKEQVDYRKADKTSLWCASWELAMR
ncbi:hypothetical protein KFE25_010609 [Diacronema lutheri]|uniref:Uncharacterized protein n=1 Tax=Diacronema lutheri TaxID=2081491 RepID=A0A8J6C462_DIALT|nr:hypothetical protein KFE25_010609 [Diacronema lutheri]